MDLDKLKAGLERLTGYDYEAAEKAARAMGDTTAEIALSKNFQAAIAAKALGKNLDDIKALPIKDYAVITSLVFNFLFSGLAG